MSINQNCAEYVTGQVALWCRRHRRKFVYSVASDPDCDGQLPEMHKFRELVLYQYGLTHADRVVVQTRRQREMMQANFGCDSVILPMPCPGPSEDDYGGREILYNGSPRVLWIGRICEVKRPDRLLDLAETCPDLNFDLVGPADDSKYARSVCERAKTITNVTLHGPASRESVSEFYKKAKIVCCTSDFEGFPNIFLEAWSYGLPIVSTFDPDNLISEKGLGKVGNDVCELADGIRELLDSTERWRDTSQSAREYFMENHSSADKVMERFEQVFFDVFNSTGDKGDGDSV